VNLESRHAPVVRRVAGQHADAVRQRDGRDPQVVGADEATVSLQVTEELAVLLGRLRSDL